MVTIFDYRYRVLLGFIIFVALLVGVLLIAWQLPGQLTKLETDSAVTSATLSLKDPNAEDVINLTYRLLQKASLHLLGVTTFAIKLPSLVLGALSGLGILWLLSSWLRRSSIALFTSVIAITTGQFLLVSSSGTPLIMPLFWTTALLLLALKLSANHKSLLWILGAGAVVGLSLYNPLSIYLIVCLLAAALLHPHLRHLLRTIPKVNALLGVLVMLIILVPLGIALFKQPSQLSILLGWPGADWPLGQIKFNALELLKAYFAFWRPQLTDIGLTPIFGIGSLCLIVLGGLKLIVDHHSARSYSLAILTVIIAVPILLQPKYAVTLFLPLILLLAIGIEALLEEWYKLFPHNPYARVVALVPVLVLLSSIIFSNLNYYTNGYRYNSDLPRYYSSDLKLVRRVIATYPAAVIVTTPEERPFYDLLRRDFRGVKTTTELSEVKVGSSFIITAGTGIPTDKLGVPKSIVTDYYQQHSPRFYVFIKD